MSTTMEPSELPKYRMQIIDRVQKAMVRGNLDEDTIALIAVLCERMVKTDSAERVFVNDLIEVADGQAEVLSDQGGLAEIMWISFGQTLREI